MQKITAVLLTLGFISSPLGAVFAQSLAQLAPSAVVEEAKKDLVESVEDLRDAKGQEGEREARLKALREAVNFSIAETEDLAKKLNALSNLSEDAEKLREEHLKTLESLLKFQNDFLAKLDNPELTLEDIKALAAEFKKWRDEVYYPATREIIDFLLVFQAADILKIAQSRFAKITGDLRKLKFSKVIDVPKLQPFLNEAGQYLDEAALLHGEALEMLFATATAATTTPEISETATTTATVDTAADPIEERTIRDVLEEMILLIKQAYKNFIAMSDLVKQMLENN